MATILSSNLLGFITPVIIFMFIFVVFFAILSKIKLFSDNKSLNSLVAFCMAVLFLVIPEARQIIEVATPWFVVFIVAGLLLIMTFMVLGIDPEFIKGVAQDNSVVLGVVVGGIIFIFLFAVTQVFGTQVLQQPGATDTGLFAIFKRTVLNPRILGFLILMIIAGEIVRRVGYGSAASK